MFYATKFYILFERVERTVCYPMYIDWYLVISGLVVFLCLLKMKAPWGGLKSQEIKMIIAPLDVN